MRVCPKFKPSISAPNIVQYVACISHTDLSELSIVGTWDIPVYQMRHKVIWFAGLVDSILLSICAIMCHWKASMTWLCAKYFQKCFSVENIIMLSLNTVIPIIVMVWQSKWLDVTTYGIFIAIPHLLLFNGSVLSNAYRLIFLYWCMRRQWYLP